MGGFMMGFMLFDVIILVIKIINCLLVFVKKELVDDNVEWLCICCSVCVDVCLVLFLF